MTVKQREPQRPPDDAALQDVMDEAIRARLGKRVHLADGTNHAVREQADEPGNRY